MFTLLRKIIANVRGGRCGTEALSNKAPRFLVPKARDGSTFHVGLRRKRGYVIGAKGDEVAVEGFTAALTALHAMDTPRWRRPNSVDNWGIVSGIEWVDQNEKQ